MQVPRQRAIARYVNNSLESTRQVLEKVMARHAKWWTSEERESKPKFLRLDHEILFEPLIKIKKNSTRDGHRHGNVDRRFVRYFRCLYTLLGGLSDYPV